MAGSEIYFVRPMAWGTEDELRQVEAARTRLEGVFAQAGALVLASTSERALRTGYSLVDGLRVPLHPSVRLKIGGFNPYGIRDLFAFFNQALMEAGVELPEAAPMVTITHQPLIEILKRDAEPGEVVPYEPDSWDNRLYRPEHETTLELEIAQTIAAQAGGANA